MPPVVIISACGLLCMGQFNRYTAIVGRVRQFHREYLDAYRRLRHAEDAEDRQLLQNLCGELERRAHGVLGLVRLIRSAFVMLMIAASLLTGVEMAYPTAGRYAAVAAFVAGLVAMLIEMAFVLAEVRVSLRLFELEHAELESHTLMRSRCDPVPEAEAPCPG